MWKLAAPELPFGENRHARRRERYTIEPNFCSSEYLLFQHFFGDGAFTDDHEGVVREVNDGRSGFHAAGSPIDKIIYLFSEELGGLGARDCRFLPGTIDAGGGERNSRRFEDRQGHRMVRNSDANRREPPRD